MYETRSFLLRTTIFVILLLTPDFKGDATKLVKKVSATNKDLQSLGGSILRRHHEILRIRQG